MSSVIAFILPIVSRSFTPRLSAVLFRVLGSLLAVIKVPRLIRQSVVVCRQVVHAHPCLSSTARMTNWKGLL